MQQTCFPSQSLFSDLVDLNVCVTVGSILQNSSLPSFLPSVSVHNNTCEQKTARLSLPCIIVSAIRMTNWQYRWGLISSYSLKGILCHNSFNKEISTLPHIKASYQGLISTLPHIKASLIFTFLLQMNTTAVHFTQISLCRVGSWNKICGFAPDLDFFTLYSEFL